MPQYMGLIWVCNVCQCPSPVFTGNPLYTALWCHRDKNSMAINKTITWSLLTGLQWSMIIMWTTTLTLKAPRKSASENVVCLCRLLHLLANFSNLHFAYRQTVWTQIRLLLKEQSDLGPHCLQKWLLKSQADDKADDNCCDWRFKG